LPLRNGSCGFVPKLFGKMTKHFSQSAWQSPNPELMAASSSLQDVQPIQSAMVSLSVPCVPWLLLIAPAGSHSFHSWTKSWAASQHRDSRSHFDRQSSKYYHLFLLTMCWPYTQGEYLNSKNVNKKSLILPKISQASAKSQQSCNTLLQWPMMYNLLLVQSTHSLHCLNPWRRLTPLQMRLQMYSHLSLFCMWLMFICRSIRMWRWHWVSSLVHPM